VRPALSSKPVELRLAPCVGYLPVRGEVAAVLEAVQCRVERPLLHLNDLSRHLLQPLRDRVAVQRSEGNDFEDQQVERALRKI
jgi:hypothetical protein